MLDAQEVKHTLNFSLAGGRALPPDERRRANLVAFRESLLDADAIIGVYDPTKRASFECVFCSHTKLSA